jgi:hypothetical protein
MMSDSVGHYDCSTAHLLPVAESPAVGHMSLNWAVRATSRVISRAIASATVIVNPAFALCGPHAFLLPRLDNISHELRVQARWVVWRAEGPKGQKPTKVPYNPTLHNTHAKSNDPETWGTFEQAEAAHAEGGYTGIGFMLSNDGLVGIDIDKCVLNGVIAFAATELMDKLGVSYFELSPSGTGLRGFGYADILDKGTSGTFNGLNVELYSNVRFLTVTGLAIKSAPLTRLVGFKELADLIRANRKVDPATGEVLDVPAAERQAELLQRILSGAKYHDSLRDLAASHVACGMQPGAVVTLLRAVMMTVSAPHDDVRWKPRYDSIPDLVTSAFSKFAQSGINTNGIMARPPLVMEMPVNSAKLVPAVTLAIPPHLLSIPGKLGIMVDWTNATSKKPQPMFAVQAALALGSVAMGRKFCTNFENWSSLYFLNIAASGTGKEHAKTAIERCLAAAGLAPLIGPCEYTSDSGIDGALLDKPTHIAVIDEFGLLLETGKAKNNPNGGTARKRLMEMFGRSHSTLQPKGYSMAGLSKAQRAAQGSRVVENPALSLLGMTTPGTFYNAVGSGSMTDGFLNRFIIVESDLGRQVGQDTEYVEPPPELVEWVKACRITGAGDIAQLQIDLQHDERPQPTIIPFTVPALRLFKELEVRCNTRMDELESMGVSEMYTRVREIAMKVSLIVAHSCEASEIGSDHAQWAIDYVCYWADRAIKSLAANVADTPFASLCNEVYNHIQKAGPHGLTEADLARKSNKFKGGDGRMRKSVFDNLAADRDVQQCEFKPRSGRGKSRLAYVAAEFLDQTQLPQ